MKVDELKLRIREIPDFPKPGILYYDISTLFLDPAAFRSTVQQLSEPYRDGSIDRIVCIESRGFILGAAMAQHLNLGMVMVRKLGKLPYRTVSETYALEYGEDTVEMHEDALNPDHRTLNVDDVLATGGTASAAGRLVESVGARISGYAFMVELRGLQGRAKLQHEDVFSLIHYD